jgi:hypothetical protein
MMKKVLGISVGLILFGGSLAWAQVEDSLEIQYLESKNTLEQFQFQNGVFIEHQKKISRVERVLESLKKRLHNLLSGLKIIIPVDNGGGATPNTPPGNTPPRNPNPNPGNNGVVDLNAIPADTGLGANGWPKYLNVPSECPPPAPDLTYYHYFGLSSAKTYMVPSFFPILGPLPIDPVTRQIAQFTEIYSYFRRSGNTFHVPLTEDEVVAAPFYTLNRSPAGIGLSSASVQPFMHGGSQIKGVSYCPGDYTNITPAGKKPLSPWCAKTGRNNLVGGIYYKEEQEYNEFYNTHEIFCQLEPNTRYFLNVELTQSNNNPCTTNTDTFTRNGKPVCAELQAQSGPSALFPAIHTIRNTVPYAGPCLDKPPYPINYASGFCGLERVRDCRPPGGSTTTGLASTLSWACHDSLGQKPSQKFTWECIDGEKFKWTEGYDKPAWSSYVCEMESSSVNSAVCSEAREGDVQLITCGGLDKNIRQCQFDTGLQSYRWIYIRSQMDNNYYQGSCSATEYTQPIPNDSCIYAGQNHSIGTKQKMQCNPKSNVIGASPFSITKECKVTGTVNGTPGIPSFVPIAGDGGGLSSNSRIRPMGHHDCGVTYEIP